MTLEKQVEELAKRLGRIEKAIAKGSDPSLDPKIIQQAVVEQYKKLEKANEADRHALLGNVSTKFAKIQENMMKMSEQMKLAKTAAGAENNEKAIIAFENRLARNEESQKKVAQQIAALPRHSFNLEQIQKLEAQAGDLAKDAIEFKKSKETMKRDLDAMRGVLEQVKKTSGADITKLLETTQKQLDEFKQSFAKMQSDLNDAKSKATAAMQLAQATNSSTSNMLGALGKEIEILKKASK